MFTASGLPDMPTPQAPTDVITVGTMAPAPARSPVEPTPGDALSPGRQNQPTGEKHIVGAGSTINIPANAPHNFRNVSGAPARMLCMCTPAGQDEYFMRIGDAVAGVDAPPPQLSPDDLAERRRRAAELAPTYRSEFL
ncbi:cupin domain-containing protein [Nonomuraea wenchangensis]